EEERAKKIIESLSTFTFQAFREEFYKDKISVKKKKRGAAKDNCETAIFEGSSIIASSFEGRNKKYGKGKFDRIRSNVDYQKLGPLAVEFGEYIKILEAQERIGTSESYFTTLINLLKFKQGLRLEDVTVNFLYSYESWMLSKNNTYTTIGIYLRNLRAIINLPKNRKLFTEESYPFGKGRYQIPTGTSIKKALDLGDV